MLLSLAGLIGAFVGLVAGWANYLFVLRIVERKLRQFDKSETAADRTIFEGKLALMRRIVLCIDVVAFSVVGYALGHAVGG
jgi:hypothetical protein